ncbi:MAG: cyclophilin-like fold protein [Candidatus Omnitrophota bacterium]
MNKIIIKSEDIVLDLPVRFLDTTTAKKIIEKLPIESKAEIWGDEIYFDTGISVPIEKATTDVNVGDVAYWPEGKCLCIFFGRTPLSVSDKPVPASEVVIVGKVSMEPDLLKKVTSGAIVKVK